MCLLPYVSAGPVAVLRGAFTRVELYNVLQVRLGGHSLRGLCVTARTLTNREQRDAKKGRVGEGRTDGDGKEYCMRLTASLFIWLPPNARSNVFITKRREERAGTSMRLYKHYQQI